MTQSASPATLSSQLIDESLNNYLLPTTFFPSHIEHRIAYSDRSRGVRRAYRRERWVTQTEPLGRGGFGVVKLQEENKTKKLRAVKEVPHHSNSASIIDPVRELIAMAALSKDESNFVKLYGWYQDSNHLYIAMEYFNLGDLRKCASNSLPELECQTIVSQVTEALNFMHMRNFAHRDLKPSNIFVVQSTPTWWVKVADFGISKRHSEDTGLYTRLSGDNQFAAPELMGFSEYTDITNAVDLWSLGCLASWLLVQDTPLSKPRDLMRYIAGQSELPLSILHKENVSSNSVDFVAALLKLDPSTRPTAAELLQNTPWLHADTADSDASSSISLEKPSTVGLTDTLTADSDSEHRNHQSTGPLSASIPGLTDALHDRQAHTIDPESSVQKERNVLVDVEELYRTMTRTEAGNTGMTDVEEPKSSVAQIRQDVSSLQQRSHLQQSATVVSPIGTDVITTIPTIQQKPTHHRTSDDLQFGPRSETASLVSLEDLRTEVNAAVVENSKAHVLWRPRDPNAEPIQPLKLRNKRNLNRKQRFHLDNAPSHDEHTSTGLFDERDRIQLSTSNSSASSSQLNYELYSSGIGPGTSNDQPDHDQTSILEQMIDRHHEHLELVPNMTRNAEAEKEMNGFRYTEVNSENPKSAAAEYTIVIPELSHLLHSPSQKDEAIISEPGSSKPPGLALDTRELAASSTTQIPSTAHSTNSVDRKADSEVTGLRSSIQNFNVSKKTSSESFSAALVEAAQAAPVLFMAASIYEFSYTATRTEYGLSYLTYVAGEVFDIIAEDVELELWLARNQDDPYRQIGWIWRRHLAKLSDSSVPRAHPDAAKSAWNRLLAKAQSAREKVPHQTTQLKDDLGAPATIADLSHTSRYSRAQAVLPENDVNDVSRLQQEKIIPKTPSSNVDPQTKDAGRRSGRIQMSSSPPRPESPMSFSPPPQRSFFGRMKNHLRRLD